MEQIRAVTWTLRSCERLNATSAWKNWRGEWFPLICEKMSHQKGIRALIIFDYILAVWIIPTIIYIILYCLAYFAEFLCDVELFYVTSIHHVFLTHLSQEKHNKQSQFTMHHLVITIWDVFDAGTQTTSSTMQFGLLLLMKHPEIAGL